MLQNWVGNGIGLGSDALALAKFKSVNLVIFWKQDGNFSSIYKDKKMIDKKQIDKRILLKTLESEFNKERQAKLDKFPKKKNDFQVRSSLLQKNGVRERPVCGLVLVDFQKQILHSSSSKSHQSKGSYWSHKMASWRGNPL